MLSNEPAIVMNLSYYHSSHLVDFLEFFKVGSLIQNYGMDGKKAGTQGIFPSFILESR